LYFPGNSFRHEFDCKIVINCPSSHMIDQKLLLLMFPSTMKIRQSILYLSDEG
jgi:hypothetical protein